MTPFPQVSSFSLKCHIQCAFIHSSKFYWAPTVCMALLYVALRTQQRTTTIKRPWSPVVSTLVERRTINSLIYLCLFNIETRKHYYLRSHSALGDPGPWSSMEYTKGFRRVSWGSSEMTQSHCLQTSTPCKYGYFFKSVYLLIWMCRVLAAAGKLFGLACGI